MISKPIDSHSNLVSQPSNEGTAFWTSLCFNLNRLISFIKQVSHKLQIRADTGTNQICTNLLIARNWPLLCLLNNTAHPFEWGHTFDLIMQPRYQCQRHFLKVTHTHSHRSTYVWPDMTTDMVLLTVTYNDTKHFPLSPGWACFTFDPVRYLVIRGWMASSEVLNGVWDPSICCPGIRDNLNLTW